ncbi:MAG: MarR family transcriptional regulator [Deltaproteobacteria bacterium]|nr:MarR family transcriptional regulator [Deltaproteobacteria bacterium]
MAASDHLALDDQLCFALYAAQRAMTRAYAPLLEPLGVTYPQYLALLVLWEADGVLVRELGDRLALDSGTLTPLLKRLEERGLVTRQRGTDDERVVRIHLTPAGKALRQEARKVPIALACRAGFDPADKRARAALAALRGELRALAERLEEPAA